MLFCFIKVTAIVLLGWLFILKVSLTKMCMAQPHLLPKNLYIAKIIEAIESLKYENFLILHYLPRINVIIMIDPLNYVQ